MSQQNQRAPLPRGGVTKPQPRSRGGQTAPRSQQPPQHQNNLYDDACNFYQQQQQQQPPMTPEQLQHHHQMLMAMGYNVSPSGPTGSGAPPMVPWMREDADTTSTPNRNYMPSARREPPSPITVNNSHSALFHQNPADMSAISNDDGYATPNHHPLGFPSRSPNSTQGQIDTSKDADESNERITSPTRQNNPYSQAVLPSTEAEEKEICQEREQRAALRAEEERRQQETFKELMKVARSGQMMLPRVRSWDGTTSPMNFSGVGGDSYCGPMTAGNSPREMSPVSFPPPPPTPSNARGSVSPDQQQQQPPTPNKLVYCNGRPMPMSLLNSVGNSEAVSPVQGAQDCPEVFPMSPQIQHYPPSELSRSVSPISGSFDAPPSNSRQHEVLSPNAHYDASNSFASQSPQQHEDAPLPAETPEDLTTEFVICVQFRHTEGYFVVHDARETFKQLGLHPTPHQLLGAYVVCDADRGIDVGVIRSLSHPTKAALNLCCNTARRNGFRGANAQPLRVQRFATRREIDRYEGPLRADEQRALEFAQAQVEKLLPGELTVERANFQFDKEKLTFFYTATQRVYFVPLLKVLNQQFKCRIWMDMLECDGTNTPVPSPPSIPKSVTEAAENAPSLPALSSSSPTEEQSNHSSSQKASQQRRAGGAKRGASQNEEQQAAAKREE